MRGVVRSVCVFLTFLAAVSAVGVIGGCNTVEGAGKDIQAAGEGIQDAAD